jgi:hypothetical protein
MEMDWWEKVAAWLRFGEMHQKHFPSFFGCFIYVLLCLLDVIHSDVMISIYDQS